MAGQGRMQGNLLEGMSPDVRETDVSRYNRRSSTLNVQKCLNILDEAVGQGKFEGSVSSQRKIFAGERDMMSFDRRTPSQRITPARRSIYGQSGDTGVTPVNQRSRTQFSIAMTPGTESMLWADATGLDIPPLETITEDITTSNVTVLLEEDPAIVACQSLYADFHRAMKYHRSHQQPLTLLEKYMQLCGDSAQLLEMLVKRAPPGQPRSMQTVKMADLLTHETKTWRLFLALYRDRLEQVPVGMDLDMLDILKKSEKQVINNLYETDSTIRQLQIIIDWLETNSAEQLDSLFTRAEYFADKNEAWSETLHVLQNNPHSISGRSLVSELDPDAPLRQKRQLTDGDSDDDVRLIKCVFAFIRAGKLSQAQQLCAGAGQSWRAATLEGWRLHHDPNVHKVNTGSIEGNPHRDIWKSACWRIANEDRVSIYERALYASLCGCLNQLLPVLESWEDHLWAYCRTTVDVLVENTLRESTFITKPFHELPAAYPKRGLSLDAIFKELQASPNERIRSEGLHRYHIVDRHIALGNTHDLLADMHHWCIDKTSPPADHFLRFMAHLTLFLKSAGGLDAHTPALDESLMNVILESYVRLLIVNKERDLVASYTATLSREQQIKCYAQFLQDIVDTNERRQCLEEAKEVCLDVHEITKLVVETIRSTDEPDISQDRNLPISVETSKLDLTKIGALEWLIFDPVQRPEAMRQANALMRSFIGVRKLAAAREVLNKLPLDSIEYIIQSSGGKELLHADNDNAIREWLCLKAYLDAQSSFSAWFDHLHESKPQRPQEPTSGQFTERVAFERRMVQYDMENERWNRSLMAQTKLTVASMYNVLLFPDGGWMIDQRKDGQRDDKRARQMRLLRQMCLPSLCMLLHSVLHTTQQYRESLQLADIICDEQHQLYKAFHKDELQLLLKKLRESSVALLNKNLDPLGYPLSV